MAALVVIGLVLCSPPATGAFERGQYMHCPGYDLGFTTAKLKAKKMSCRGAREIFRKWQNKVDCGGDGPCERARVKNFVCRFGGTEARITLDCKHRERPKALKARWTG